MATVLFAHVHCGTVVRAQTTMPPPPSPRSASSRPTRKRHSPWPQPAACSRRRGMTTRQQVRNSKNAHDACQRNIRDERDALNAQNAPKTLTTSNEQPPWGTLNTQSAADAQDAQRARSLRGATPARSTGLLGLPEEALSKIVGYLAVCRGGLGPGRAPKGVLGAAGSCRLLRNIVGGSVLGDMGWCWGMSPEALGAWFRLAGRSVWGVRIVTRGMEGGEVVNLLSGLVSGRGVRLKSLDLAEFADVRSVERSDGEGGRFVEGAECLGALKEVFTGAAQTLRVLRVSGTVRGVIDAVCNARLVGLVDLCVVFGRCFTSTSCSGENNGVSRDSGDVVMRLLWSMRADTHDDNISPDLESNLRTLRLVGCRFNGSSSFTAPDALACAVPRLTTLALDTFSNTGGVEILAQAARLPFLERLELSNGGVDWNGVKWSSVRPLLDCHACPLFKQLSLSQCIVVDMRSRLCDVLRDAGSRLRCLSLDQTSAGYLGVKEVETIAAHCHQLNELCVNLTVEGAAAMSCLVKSAPTLETLRFGVRPRESHEAMDDVDAPRAPHSTLYNILESFTQVAEATGPCIRSLQFTFRHGKVRLPGLTISQLERIMKHGGKHILCLKVPVIDVYAEVAGLRMAALYNRNLETLDISNNYRVYLRTAIMTDVLESVPDILEAQEALEAVAPAVVISRWDVEQMKLLS